MTPRDAKPKTGPTTRTELNSQIAQRRRALNALEQVTLWQARAWRWRQIVNWTPPTDPVWAKASNKMVYAEKRMFDYLTVVRRALGYDPDADPPPPQTHWDKGAMEDPK